MNNKITMRLRFLNTIRNEKGNALLWAMMAISLYFVLVTSLAIVLISEIRQSDNIDQSTQAYMAQETAEDRAINYINHDQITSGDVAGWITNNGSITYTFNVWRKGQRQNGILCGYDYCYRVIGSSGNVKRERDGSYYGSSGGESLIMNSLNFAVPPTDTSYGVLNLNSAPTQSVSRIRITSMNQEMTLMGRISGESISGGGNVLSYDGLYRFGFYESFGSSTAQLELELFGSSPKRARIGWYDGTTWNYSSDFIYLTKDGKATGTDLGVDNYKFRFALTYHKDSRATLKIFRDIPSKDCIGIITTYNVPSTLGPILFLNPNLAVSRDPGCSSCSFSTSSGSVPSYVIGPSPPLSDNDNILINALFVGWR